MYTRQDRRHLLSLGAASQLLLSSLAVLASACSATDDQGTENTALLQDALAVRNDGYGNFGQYPNKFYFCFMAPSVHGNDAEYDPPATRHSASERDSTSASAYFLRGYNNGDLVKNTLEYTWQSIANLIFSAPPTFKTCPSTYTDSMWPPSGTVSSPIPISLAEGGGMGATSVTEMAYPQGAIIHEYLGGLATPQMFAHEVGHALGYTHENNRSDYPSSYPCYDVGRQDNNGPTYYTPPDRYSLMIGSLAGAPCGLNPPFSFWDVLGAQAKFGQRVPAIVPLATWSTKGTTSGTFHFATGTFGADNTNAVIFDRFAAQPGQNLGPSGAEGWMWDRNHPAPGTAPLYLMYNAGTGDYLTTSVWYSWGLENGYTDLGVIGYIYTATSSGLAQINNLEGPGDNLTAVYGSDEYNTALSNGYQDYGPEGYVFSTLPTSLLRKYARYSPSGVSEMTIATVGGPTYSKLNKQPCNALHPCKASARSPYDTVFSGAAIATQQAGSVGIYNYYCSSRNDYVALAASGSPSPVVINECTYEPDQIPDGYVFQTQFASDMIPLRLSTSSANDAHTWADITGSGSDTVVGYVLRLSSYQ